MLYLAKRTCCIGFFFIIAGCASVSVDQLHVYNGAITSGDLNPRVEQEVPTTSISQKDRVHVITHVSWDSIDDDGGIHTVSWLWYSEGKIVAKREKDLHFKKTPYRFWQGFPASDFGVGHYRVDVAIDGKVVDTHEFDITQ